MFLLFIFTEVLRLYYIKIIKKHSIANWLDMQLGIYSVCQCVLCYDITADTFLCFQKHGLDKLLVSHGYFNLLAPVNAALDRLQSGSRKVINTCYNAKTSCKSHAFHLWFTNSFQSVTQKKNPSSMWGILSHLNLQSKLPRRPSRRIKTVCVRGCVKTEFEWAWV